MNLHNETVNGVNDLKPSSPGGVVVALIYSYHEDNLEGMSSIVDDSQQNVEQIQHVSSKRDLTNLFDFPLSNYFSNCLF